MIDERAGTRLSSRGPEGPRLSLVFATFNRLALAERLLVLLGEQDLPASEFEVVAVDDGSTGDVADRLRALTPPFRLEVIAQTNQGPAIARHRGIAAARGEVIVVVDDDMKVPTEFLRVHLDLHSGGPHRVVLGHIRPDPGIDRMPIFERYHAAMLDLWVRGVEEGRIRVRGNDVCTGNVSFRRADYFAVGGFDASLARSEDAELGLRLEKSGCDLLFSRSAYSIHGSDHQDLGRWMDRAFRYGSSDLRIAHKHPDLPWASPWRFLFLVHPVSRPLLGLATLFPGAGRALAWAAMRAALGLDQLGAQGVAIAGTTLVYGLLYFCGVRHEAGNTREALADFRRYWAQARRATP